MCIIAIKEKGCDFPARESIINCIATNPDGFALAWNDMGKLHTFRTMDRMAVLRKYDEISRLDPGKTAMIFHARIATHGSKKRENCHCWTGGGLAFAHNGILAIGNRDDMTDSETFFRDYFLPAYSAYGWVYAKRIIDLVIGRSKFAFIDSQGEIHRFGDFVSNTIRGKRNVVLYSNTSFMPRLFFGNFAGTDTRPARKSSSRGPLYIRRNEQGEIVENRIVDDRFFGKKSQETGSVSDCDDLPML